MAFCEELSGYLNRADNYSGHPGIGKLVELA